jgi:acyl-CoA dehydrogenase
MSIAEMWVELETARLAVLQAAWLADTAPASRNTRAAAVAKLHATEAAFRVVDRALQLHGGLGVVRGQAVERLYREIRALRIYEGTSEIQKLVIGRDILR